MADADIVPDYSQKSVDDLWTEWKVQYKKTYNTEEEERNRFEIFKETKKHVEEHNEKYKKGESTYVLGINKFADLKPHEVCGCMSNKHRCEEEEEGD